MRPRASVRWTPVALFLLLAFGISWTLWIAAHLVLPWWILAIAAWGPGIAALLVRGPLLREGFRDSGLLRIGASPNAWWPYAVAFLLPAVAVGASTLAGVAAGAFQLDWDEMRAVTSSNILVGWVSDHLGLPGLLASFFIVPFLPVIEAGEEIGWRDYLVPRLLPLGEAWAFLISGAVWAIWHLPYNLLLGFNGGAAGFPLFAAYTVLLGAVLGLLRLRSGSVWPCAVLHAAANYLPYVAITLTAVGVGVSSTAPEQSVAIFMYATMMLAGLVALILAWRSGAVQSGGV